ncbi:MAG: double-strand break repair protein AddB [Rhodospirillaceae bacterium]|nr:double-strand break repair protein AddB [Rhodospirillaceae bacterium]
MTETPINWLSDSSRSGQKVWTIPTACGFVDALADGLLAETGGDPMALAETTVLLPTRRAIRSLREAFGKRTEVPMLLPRLLPLQDIDEDEDEELLSGFAAEVTAPLDIPPAIAPLSRQILLARLIMKKSGADGRQPGPDQAARLAQELARFLNQAQTERLSFDALTNLVPDDLAAHWQTTLTFLQVVTHSWPEILEQRGEIDPAEHRNRVLAAQAAAWRDTPPKGLVIAAGSTGSIPVTRDLLAVVSTLPNGCVVLPGLDQYLDDASWASVKESHPQFNLKALLGHLDVERAAVLPWPKSTTYETGEHRRVLISEIMRPADTSEKWRALAHLQPGSAIGIQKIEAPTPREEAAAIALALRWVVAEGGELTGALVTPDRNLARRVASELERWSLTVNDSAGQPLAMTPHGVFLRLTAAMIAENCAPVPLLSALKHPLASCGLDPPQFRDHVRALERAILRGPRPPGGMDGLRQTLAAEDDHDPALDAWLTTVAAIVEPFSDLAGAGAVSLYDLLSAHLTMAGDLAKTDDTDGSLHLWAGPVGGELNRFFDELRHAAGDMGYIDPRTYPSLLDALMEKRVSRPPYPSHPRLSILGPLEARLLRPDVLILGGLNEGSWPSDPAADPWMSRPMRKAFGLPQPERRIGKAAHDVAQALGAPDVIMTRSLKVEGTPTVASRWWRRFDQVVEAAGIPVHSERGRYAWLPLAAALTRPTTIAPLPAPAPKPPVEARPRRLSVTEIERWMRDPYEIYARHVLKLRALDPLDADASRADYGIIVHDILQTFVETYPDQWPKDAAQALERIAAARFGQADLAPGVQAFWQPRFDLIAAWFFKTELHRRTDVKKVLAEVRGEIVVDGPAGPFTLVAKADRIEVKADGTVAIVDYKTGAVPRPKEVEAGFAPQLPLEAVIAAAGGFNGLKAAQVSELLYWQLTGRGDGGESSPAGTDADALRTEALEGLLRLIATFDDPNTAYAATPHPGMAPAYGDTQHLARVKEWATVEGGDG